VHISSAEEEVLLRAPDLGLAWRALPAVLRLSMALLLLLLGLHLCKLPPSTQKPTMLHPLQHLAVNRCMFLRYSAPPRVATF
jgi:hypothetical protein